MRLSCVRFEPERSYSKSSVELAAV